MCIVCFAKNCAVLVFSKFDSDFTILFIKNLKQFISKKNDTRRKKEFWAIYSDGIIKKWMKPYQHTGICFFEKWKIQTLCWSQSFRFIQSKNLNLGIFLIINSWKVQNHSNLMFKSLYFMELIKHSNRSKNSEKLTPPNMCSTSVIL